GEGILPRLENHSPTRMGMPSHFYLVVDETSRAHPASLAKLTEAIWRDPQDRQLCRAHIPIGGTNRGNFGRRTAQMCARLSREEFTRHGSPGRERRRRS